MFFKILKTTTAVALFGIFLVSASPIARAAVIANVGDKKISEDDVRSEFEKLGDEQKKAINKDVVARRSIVDNAVNTEVLVQAAKKAGFEKDAEFNQAVDRFKRQYLASKFLEKAVEPKLATSSVKKFYESNKRLFDSSEVCAFHIVVQEEEAARKITAEAKGKSNFEELAKKHSLDPSVQENKGDLGCFTRDKMVPQFADAAFGMKKGEIKGPILTSYGYHVIKVYDTKPGKAPGYEEVEQRVKETYRFKLMQDTLTELRAKSNVKVNEEEVKKFKL